MEDASTDTTNKDTNQEHITLTDSLENCSESVEPEKLENVSENPCLTPNMLESGGPADIKPKSFISHMSPSEPLPGEHSPSFSAVKFTPKVCVTADMHTEEECFPSLNDPSDVLVSVFYIFCLFFADLDLKADIYDEFDVPSSSPPASSPLTSGYFRSSSPIPMASSPCGDDLTPPTSPVKTSTEGVELANIQIDEFKEVCCLHNLILLVAD